MIKLALYGYGLYLILNKLGYTVVKQPSTSEMKGCEHPLSGL